MRRAHRRGQVGPELDVRADHLCIAPFPRRVPILAFLQEPALSGAEGVGGDAAGAALVLPHKTRLRMRSWYPPLRLRSGQALCKLRKGRGTLGSVSAGNQKPGPPAVKSYLGRVELDYSGTNENLGTDDVTAIVVMQRTLWCWPTNGMRYVLVELGPFRLSPNLSRRNYESATIQFRQNRRVAICRAVPTVGHAH